MSQQRNVIIDTDMGWDDVLSILYLMKNPKVKILGITVTGCGETHLDQGVEIAQALLEMGNIDAAVCKGASMPSQYHHQFPESFRNTMDDVCGLKSKLPKVTKPFDPRPAWEFIRDELANEEYQITILSIGGLTNIARLLEYDDLKLENIERIIIMGGSINDVDGNVAALNNAVEEWNQGPAYASNIYAEWNIFLDPMAAKKVLSSSIPITLVPLNACDYVLLEEKYFNMITATDEVANLAKELIGQKTTGPAKEPIPLPIFDPLAAMITADDLRVIAEELRIDVETVEDNPDDNTCGQTYVSFDERIPKINVVTDASENEFGKAFSKVMNTPLTPLPSEIINKNVGILLFDHAEVLDLAGAFEVLAAARNSDGSKVFNVVTIANDNDIKEILTAGEPVIGDNQSKLSINADSFKPDFKPDVLIVIGGQGIDGLIKDDTDRLGLFQWIKNTSEKAEYVAGICSGVLLLAKAHLLNGLAVTTHHTRFDQLGKMSQDEKMKLKILDTRNGSNFIHDPASKFMTSGGVNCGTALAIHIARIYLGEARAQALAHDVLEYTIPRGEPDTPQGFPLPNKMDPRKFVLGFSHLNVIVSDLKMMNEATEFYQRVLGFEQAWSLWLPKETCTHFAHDAGFEDGDCKVMVRFLIHPNAQIHLELMLYDHPKGDQNVHYHKTNDVGGIRHVAMEVTDAVSVYNWLKNQPGVKMLMKTPPEKLTPDPQRFFYWLDPYGVQWEMEEGRPMARVINGIIG
jgi:inosine-uridine nucleoside N-ribohydrolase/transcriptional regulator GlxA family with amidase domain/catechol 2,3-dioxygenase-like lactoylglutathione lyase family enzyme